MEFFIPCWIALSSIFAQPPSKTYFNKVSRTFADRMEICNNVAVAAAKRNHDPILFIAISVTETGFTNTKSKKGAKGPLGVIPKYHCPKKGNCDYINAGIDAFEKAKNYVDSDDLCQTLAIYNRGIEEGKCEKGRSEYNYAQYVIELYEKICLLSDHCESC